MANAVHSVLCKFKIESEFFPFQAKNNILINCWPNSSPLHLSDFVLHCVFTSFALFAQEQGVLV